MHVIRASNPTPRLARFDLADGDRRYARTENVEGERIHFASVRWNGAPRWRELSAEHSRTLIDSIDAAIVAHMAPAGFDDDDPQDCGRDGD